MQAFTIFGRAAERCVGELAMQNLANTSWAFATAHRTDVPAFIIFGRTVERCLGSLKPQDLANTTCACASGEAGHERLQCAGAHKHSMGICTCQQAASSMHNGSPARRGHMYLSAGSEFNAQELINIAWAHACASKQRVQCTIARQHCLGVCICQ